MRDPPYANGSRRPGSAAGYDVSVNGALRAVVVGSAIVEVEGDPAGSVITIIAVDTADNESAPGTIAVGF